MHNITMREFKFPLSTPFRINGFTRGRGATKRILFYKNINMKTSFENLCVTKAGA